MPVIGFGAWPIGGGMGTIDARQAIRTLHHALDQGVTLVDTAEAYRSSEEVIGRALATWSGPRDRVFLATKVRSEDLSAAHIAEAVERSLRLLGVETIDLLQAHGCVGGRVTDPDAAVCAARQAMHFRAFDTPLLEHLIARRVEAEDVFSRPEMPARANLSGCLRSCCWSKEPLFGEAACFSWRSHH